ncbi:MAG: excinuclease ABC subunit UvrC [Myxococcota bacterium]|nr:excinuclease ABC subunit UvrC [Myxococcota bacterium]MEC9391318.1 excinuclease ABC subunit UvrC [Myxococcota bacterium]
MGHDALDAAARDLPRGPGVYLFKDARGRVLYVGKAKDLKSRVSQYVLGHDERPMVPHLMRRATAVEVTEVRTEKEALILENTLIKKHRPRYNVRLRDDSSFLHLKIDPKGDWPRYRITRERKGSARFFGPYASAHRARITLEFLSRRFPLRTCTDDEMKRRKRPCLLHQMHRCLAPCVDACTTEDYANVVEQSMLFLDGKNRELLGRLNEQMMTHAEREEYEDAARVRDVIRAVQSSLEAQIAADGTGGNHDAWAIVREGDRAMAVLLPVRAGRMHEVRSFPVDEVVGENGEVLSSLLLAWYESAGLIPGLVLLNTDCPEVGILEEVLGERRGRTVEVRRPVRGDKVRVVELALKNAEGALRRALLRHARTDEALDRLQEVARLGRRPHHIECFDNSNIQGTDPVASQVVFIDGIPDRQRYRRYRVRSVQGPDDYATMREILERRVKRSRKPDAKPEDALPDLIVVDGGKGQVSVVQAVLADLGAHNQPVIGLAKPRVEVARGDRFAVDKVVVPGLKDPQRLRSNDPALLLLQALRDESHRTAVQYHRKVRRSNRLISELDGIPGVGPARRKALLTRFGSVQGVRSASVEELTQLSGVGPALATAILAALGESTG